MSEENVEIVRRVYTERLIDQEPERLVEELATPDIGYVNPPTRSSPAFAADLLRSPEPFDGPTTSPSPPPDTS